LVFVSKKITLKEFKTTVYKADTLREQTKKLEAVYSTKLQELEELKKRVLNKAFRGELN
jgi:type I restriction enzyme S subunit